MSRSALFVTDVQLFPALSGNRLRIRGFIRALRDLGLDVTLIAPPDVAPIEELRTLVDDFLFVRARRFSGGRLVDFDPRPFRRAVTAAAARLRPAVVVAQYAWLAPALSGLPRGVERWIDCHDLLHERTERFGAAGLDAWVTCSWEQERARLACADVIIATQEREAMILQRLLPDKCVKCILTPVDLPLGFSRQRGHGTTVLAVGAHHAGNMGVVEFARDAWPRVMERVPGARLHVVGGIGAALGPLPNVEVFGRVPDLLAHYAAAAVVICPMTIGTGIKTKMVEALRFGKAVVATAPAAEGMPIPEGRAWMTTESLSACADMVADLLSDGKTRAEMEDAAFAFGKKHGSLEAFREQIRLLLPAFLTDAPDTAPPRAAQRLVSVVVPQVGRLSQLRVCLASLANQSYPHPLIEIIVVVHGVDPKTGAALEREFPEVTLVHVRHAGAARARNRGAAKARGSFIAFLDSDCRADRDWLANAIAAEQAHHAIIACNIRPALGPGATGTAWYNALMLHERRYVVRAYSCAASAIVLPRTLWETLGGFDEALPGMSAAGRVWSERAVARGTSIHFAPEARAFLEVARTWAGLRAIVRALHEDERRLAGWRHDDVAADRLSRRYARAMRLEQELRLALQDRRLPWHARPGAAFAAILVWRWCAEGRAPLPSADAVDPITTTDLPLTSISVIVPCLGWPDTLPACLRSVQAQVVDVPVDITIVINGADVDGGDHSWHGTRIVREQAAGPAAARNTGVRASTGDVLAFIDADCVAAKDWLASGFAALREASGGDIIAGAISRSGARLGGVALYDSVTYLRQRDYVQGAGGCVTANLFVHRALFQHVGPFDEIFSEAAFEDWEWAMRARKMGIHLVYAAATVVDHPCMSSLDALRRKAERLARGAIVMQRKLGRPIASSGLFISLGREMRAAFRHRRMSFTDRLRLICIGMAVAFWGWQAGRGYRRSILKGG